MLDPQTLSQLADFWSPQGKAVSFYFSETHSDNLAHTTTMLTAREEVRSLLTGAQDTSAMRALAARIEERAGQFRNSHPSGLAIFASTEPETWHEVELPFSVPALARVDTSFTLGPLAPMLKEAEKYFILLLDRSVTRLLFYTQAQIEEQTREFGVERFPVRETGASRKKSDERSRDDDAFHHLRDVGTRLEKHLERGEAKYVFLGCRNELWPEIQAAFPDTLVRRVLGHFPCDPGLVTAQEVGELARAAVEEHTREQMGKLLEDALGGAAANRDGAVGPEAVITALEMGETEVILVGPHDAVPVSVCTSCSHIDLGPRTECTLCGGPSHPYPDLTEVLARRGGTGAFTVTQVPQVLPKQAHGFAAKLRFRADQTHTQVA